MRKHDSRPRMPPLSPGLLRMPCHQIQKLPGIVNVGDLGGDQIVIHFGGAGAISQGESGAPLNDGWRAFRQAAGAAAKDWLTLQRLCVWRCSSA
jgi:hypothetical protein